MSLIIYVSENYVDIESTKTSTYFFFIFFHLRRWHQIDMPRVKNIIH